MNTGRMSGGEKGKLARDRIFEVAADLFYRMGIRAVGVETIVKEAGVAKISLYRSFPSKDDLIVSYLEERNESFWRQWDERFDRYKADASALLRAIMSHLAHRTTQAGYRGCPFINYSVEFPDPAHPVHRIAREHKEMIRSYIRGLLSRGNAQTALPLSEQLYLLFEGAITASQLHGEPWPAEYARQAAHHLLSAPEKSDAHPAQAPRRQPKR